MLAIIGGSGLYSLGEDFELDVQASRDTPFGETSADILQGRWHELALIFCRATAPAIEYHHIVLTIEPISGR
jgi:purine nucleoside phosphorylase